MLRVGARTSLSARSVVTQSLRYSSAAAHGHEEHHDAHDDHHGPELQPAESLWNPITKSVIFFFGSFGALIVANNAFSTKYDSQSILHSLVPTKTFAELEKENNEYRETTEAHNDAKRRQRRFKSESYNHKYARFSQMPTIFRRDTGQNQVAGQIPEEKNSYALN